MHEENHCCHFFFNCLRVKIEMKKKSVIEADENQNSKRYNNKF